MCVNLLQVNVKYYKLKILYVYKLSIWTFVYRINNMYNYINNMYNSQTFQFYWVWWFDIQKFERKNFTDEDLAKSKHLRNIDCTTFLS